MFSVGSKSTETLAMSLWLFPSISSRRRTFKALIIACKSMSNSTRAVFLRARHDSVMREVLVEFKNEGRETEGVYGP